MTSNRVKIRIKQKIKKSLRFLKEVKLEIKKINWLTVKEALKYTVIVIFSSVILAIILGGMDFVFTLFLEKFIIH